MTLSVSLEYRFVFIIMGATLLSVALINTEMLVDVKLCHFVLYRYSECRDAEYCYTICHKINVIMLSVIFYFYAECRFSERCYAKYSQARCY